MSNELFVPEGWFDPIFWSGKTDKLDQLFNTYFTLLNEGKTIVKWVGEGDQTEKEVVCHPMKILIEIQYCLKLLNPAKYGPIVTRVKPFHI